MATTMIVGRRIAAAVFDMDGVITDTASIHAAAWAEVFDAYLQDRSRRLGEPFEPFTDDDYLRYVDGVARHDGVRRFLASRGIDLEEGHPDDPPSLETVHGVGNRKNARFVERLERDGANRYEPTVTFVRWLIERDVPVAAISASRNTDTVLTAAGVGDLFPVRVDGDEAARLDLPGKPDPAVFLEAARRLGSDPGETMVVEDALAGVEAARRGGFGLVIGLDRGGHGDELAARGADVVVEELTDLLPGGPGLVPAEPGEPDQPTPIRDLSHVDGRWDGLCRTLTAATPVVFLDVDGTLSPIVDDAAPASIPEATRKEIERLARRCPVVIVSGRDADDVRARVGIDDITYAGSHGSDVVWPDGDRRGTEYLDELDRTEQALQVAEAVGRIASASPQLRCTGDNKEFEPRRMRDWETSSTVLWVLERLGATEGDVVPLYIGDNVTDEDAFAALDERGVRVVVQGEDDDRPTHADLRVRNVDEVRALLERIRSALGGEAA